MSRLLGSVRRPWMVALFAVLAAVLAIVFQSASPSMAVQAPSLNNAPIINSTGSFGVSTGKLLSVNTGDWTDSPTGYTYQWYRCTSSLSATSSDPTNCQIVSGSTSSTHRLSRSDTGFYMVAKVTATNGLGSTYTYSASTVQVRQANSTANSYGFLCQLRTGRLYCAGGNGGANSPQGQLVGSVSFGGIQKTFFGPVALKDGTVLTDLVSIAGSDYNVCVINIAGNVFCNGNANSGMFTDGFGTGQRQLFTQMNASAGVPITGATSIAVTDNSYCFTKVTAGVSNVWCAGTGVNGQMAQSNVGVQTYPVKAMVSSGVALTGALQVVGGSLNTGNGGTYCALVSDGTTVGAKIYCWGMNNFAQLGQGDTTARSTYMTALTVNGSTTGFSYITTGVSTCAIQNSGLYCWGGDNVGQLGQGSTSTTVRLTPTVPSNTATGVSFAANNGWVQVEVSDSSASTTAHVCALNVTGAVYCSGYNTWQQLDQGAAGGTTNLSTFKATVDWTSGVADIDLADSSSCAYLPATGAFSCIGNNTYGQWGNGTTTSITNNAAALTTPAGTLGSNPAIPSVLTTNISGNNATASTLTQTSTWLGFPYPTLSHQWYSCTSAVTAGATVPGGCTAISGATNPTYLVSPSDSGFYISDFVTATNEVGSTSTMLTASNPVGDLPTMATAPTLTTPVSSIGAAIGLTFSGTSGSWSNVSPVGTTSFQWYRCYNAGTETSTIPADCSPIYGATNSSYTSTRSDGGQYLRFGEVYTSTAGTVTALSATTTQVRIVTSLSGNSGSGMCAMRLGRLYCWGKSYLNGRMGDPNITSMLQSANPVVNADGSPMTDVVQFATSTDNSCAIKIDRTLWCWGQNFGGQMGTGTTTTSVLTYLTATKVTTTSPTSSSNTWAQVAITGSNVGATICAIDVAGDLWCSGSHTNGGYGADGISSAKYTFTKSANAAATGLIQISAIEGYSSSNGSWCALKKTGAVICWGQNIKGELGTGTQSQVTSLYTPYLMDSQVNLVDLGDSNGCAIKLGALYCWGRNGVGQLGTGGSDANFNAVQPQSLGFDVSKGIVDVIVAKNWGTPAYSMNCAINNQGVMACAGANTSNGFMPFMSAGSYQYTFAPARWSNVSGAALAQDIGCVVLGGNVQCSGVAQSGGLGTGYSNDYFPANPLNVAGLNGKVGVLDGSVVGSTVTTSQNFAVGNSITTSVTTDSAPSPSLAYQWYRCSVSGGAATSVPANCSAIAGATAASYTITADDLGLNVRVAVTLTNYVDSAIAVSASGVVGTAPTVSATPTGSISQGVLKLLTGQTLTAPTAPSFSGSPAPSTSIKWYRCTSTQASWVTVLPTGCSPVEGGTGSTYTTTHGDDGFFLIASFTGSNTAGSLTYFTPSSTRVIYSNSISVGSTDTLCLIKLGKVYCWGSGAGILQTAKTVSDTPIKLANGKDLTDAISITVGFGQACAVTYSGSAYCWGTNSSGQLGDGTLASRFTAAPVLTAANTPLTGVTRISISSQNACAINADQAVVCWGGNNPVGGTPGSVKSYATTMITGLGSGVQQLSLGNDYGCALQNAGLRCWGNSSNYQVDGVSSSAVTAPGASPSLVYNLKTVNLGQSVSNIYAGNQSVCVVKLGRVWCLGRLYHMANYVAPGPVYINPGLPTNTGSPVLESDVVAVYSGLNTSNTNGVPWCAQKVDGSVQCVASGINAYGVGTVTQSQSWASPSVNLTSGVSEITLNLNTNCAVMSGSLKCAGYGSNYPLQNGSTSQVTNHAQVVGYSSMQGVVETAPVVGTNSITGYATVGGVLTANWSDYQNSGAWQGMPTPSMQTQWFLCDSTGSATSTLPSDCSELSGETNLSYTIQQSHFGKYFRIKTTATNAFGTVSTISATMGPVADPPVATNYPTLNGPSGAVLNNAGTISGNAANFTSLVPQTITHQWYHCSGTGTASTSLPSDCIAIPNATSLTYAPSTSDVSGYLRLASTSTNVAGQVTRYSATSSQVVEGALVASTTNVTCVVKLGRVYCWGSNTKLELGNGDSTTSNSVSTSAASTPVKRNSTTILEDIVNIEGGADHVCASDTSGAVWCWGAGVNNGRGDGLTTASAYAVNPSNAADGTSFTSGVIGMSIGQSINCVWKNTGAVYCWGLGTYGLADGTANASSIPVASSVLSSGVTKVSTGANFGCAIKSGRPYCWGAASVYQGGDSGSGIQLTPTARTQLPTSDYLDVSSDSSSSCYLKAYAVVCTGSNSSGSFGNGLTTGGGSTAYVHTTGVLSSGITSIYGVSNNSQIRCFGTASQSVYCAGQNYYGLVPGTTGDVNGQQYAPILSSYTKVSSIASNQLNATAGTGCLVSNGTLYCNGLNSAYNLGNGNTTAIRASASVASASVAPSGFEQYLGVDWLAPILTSAPTVTAPLTYGGSTATVPVAAGIGYPTPMVTSKWLACTQTGTAATTIPTDCSEISGATSSSYGILSSDIGIRLRATFAATNSVGSVRAVSATTTLVAKQPQITNFVKPQGATTTTQVGATLTQAKANWSLDPVYPVTYAWARCGNESSTVTIGIPSDCALIADATTSSYTVVSADTGNYIRAVQIATGAAGTYYALSPTGPFVLGVSSKLAMNSTGSCVIKNGGVWCVGQGNNGSLGNNNTISSSTPVQVLKSATAGDYLTNVVAIYGSKYGYSYCAIDDSAKLWCWGASNTSYVYSSSNVDYKVATQILSTSRVAQVAFGYNGATMCAITDGATGAKGGALYCWGNEGTGSSWVGDGTVGGNKPITSKVLINLDGVTQVSGATFTFCAVTKVGALYCWGNGYANKSLPLAANATTPTLVSGFDTGVSRVAVGGYEGCAIKDGGVWCWGGNANGPQGTGSATASNTPTQVATATDGTSLASGVTSIDIGSENTTNYTETSCAIKSTGLSYCWGYGTSGSRFDGSTTTAQLSPKPTNLGTGVTQIVSNYGSSCALVSAALTCVGTNTSSMAFVSTGLSYSTPTAVAAFSNTTTSSIPTVSAVLPSAAYIGQPINADHGSATGLDTPTFSYSWFTCSASQIAGTSLPSGCVASTGGGASTQTYTPVSAERGKYLITKVVATNAAGTATAYSASAGPIAAGPQQITVSGTDAILAPGGPNVQLTANSSAGLTDFTWSTSTPTVCSVSSTGAVTALIVGLCEVTASQAGNSDVGAASTSVKMSSKRDNQTITWDSQADVGFSASPLVLNASISSGLPITFTSSTPAVCTASGSSVTSVSLGTCTLDASQAGTVGFFAAPSVTKSFQIVQGSQTITLAGRNIDLADGTYSLDGTSSSGLTLEYSTSSSASICTLSGNTITMNAPGNCVVTASQSGNTNFAAASSVTATYRILSTPTPDSSIEISGTPTWGVSYGATPGVWAGSGTVTVTTQWYACDNAGTSIAATGDLATNLPADCSAIAGATSATFNPTAAEVGKRLRVAEQASNVIGGNTNYYTVITAASAAVVKQSQTITFGTLTGVTYGVAPITLSATSSRSKTITYASSNTSVCTISGSTLTVVGAGSCDVTASQSGDATTLAASDVIQTLTVAKANQTITLPAFTAGVYGGSAKASGATASSGLTVTLTSADTSVCTVTGLNVNIVAPGTCSITASQAGDSNYNAATSVTGSFTISKAAQTITFAPTTKQKPAGDFAAGGASSSGLTVSYSSSTTSVCTVSGSSVSPVGLGTCTITASQAGDSNYNAATSVTASFTIESVPVQTTAISIAPAANYRFGTAITTTAGNWTGTATVAISRAWYRCETAPSISAGTGSAASLAPADCALISGAVGTSYTPVAADITKFVAVAETASNTTSTGANSRTTIVSTATAVEKQTQTITFAALSNATYGDAAISLTASSDRSMTITYASSNTAVCTVSGSTLTVVAPGTCDVTASQAGDATTLAATSVTRTLTVGKANQTITMPNFTAGVYGGAAKASGASASSGLTVTLTSNDTAVCTVSGLSVNIVAPGTCSITASQAGNTNYNAAADVTKSFTISKASQTITFAPTTKQKPAGDFAAGGSATSGLTVTYVSTTTSVCTVSGSTVSPVGLGTCIITASQAGDSNWSAAADVTASFTIESVPVQTTAEFIASAANYRFGVPVTVTAGTWTGTAAVTVTRAWFRCDTAPSISVGTGTATALKPADCTAISGATNTSYTPVAADITKYLAVAETASNTTSTGSNLRTTFVSTATAVEKQTQTITFGALANATYGDPTISLTASSDRSLTITYTSSNTAVCTVAGSTLTVVAPGTCDVTALQAGNATTLAATSVVQTLTVVKANQTVSLNNLAAIDFRGTPTTLVYSSTSGLPVTVASNSTSVCTVSGTTVSVVAVGTCSITASQAGNSNYNAASSVTKTFVISKAQDTLTFTGATKQFRAGNFTISASTLSGASVSFTSTTASICTVSGTTVTPVTHGACVISATAASNSNYIAPANVNATFTIERAVEQTTVHSLTSYATYWYDQRIDYTAGTWVGSGTVSVTHTWYICDTRPTTIVVAANTIPTGCTAVAETSTDAYKPVAADIGKYVVLAETASNVTSGVTNIAKSWISTPGRVTKWTQNLTFGALADKTYGDLPFTLNGISDQGQPVSYASSNTSVCTVSGSVVSIVAAGSCDITASQAGNTTIAAATPITQTLTVNKASQTITFAALSNVTYSSATISIAPTAASQLAVTSVSDDTSVCTLTNNVISVLKAGTCSITASQAGNTNYNAANSVTRTFQIAKASQTVEFTPPQFLGLQQHEGVDLVATSTSGLSVTFSVSNTAICDIQSGKLIPVSTGACVITVAQAGDDRYEASSDIHTVTVADYPVVDAFAPSGDLYTNTSATSFTITFASAVTGFAAEDLVTIPAGACTIAEPQLIPASSASYTVELTGCAEGPVSLKLLENTVSNGIPGPAEFSVSTASVGIDFAFANGVTITPGFTSPTNDTALVYTVTFAEAVTGFDASDLEITGTGSADCVATVTGSGASYTVSLADCTDGTVVLKTKAQSVADLAANVGPSTTVTAAAVTVDRVAPEGPTVTGMPTQYSRSTDLNANFTVDNQLTYRCQLNGVDLPGCDGSLVIPAGSLSSGDYTLEIWAVDAAGNESTRYSHSFSIGSYARPSAPVIGLLDRTSYNHLVVNWAAVTAQSTELPVTALRFEYSVNGGGTWTAADDLAADATSYDLTVQSGQTYSIRLKALSGDYAANASDFSATASYVAVYKPTITGASTSAALLKPATGTVITLTGNDLRDFSVINPALNTGTVVTIIDSANKTYTAELVSVTATSIRFKVPAVSKVGVATYKVTVGSASYQRTSANRNLNIVAKKVNQVITFTAPASTKVGNADTQLGATLDSLAAPVYNLAASSTGICTLTSTGVLHPIKGGVCSYTITSPASDAFNAFTSSTYNTTINRMDVAVAFELPADLLAGLDSNNSMPIKPITYSLTAIPSDQVQGVSATIWATPETVCFVDADKVLRIIAVGTCTVSAVAENDYYRTTTPVTRSFTIVKNDQNLTYVAPGTTFGMITAPEATDATSGFQLTAFLDSGLTPDFASLTTQVCTVDPSGFVAWVGDLVKNPAQVCDVTIGQAGDSNFNAIPTQTIHLTARHVPPQPPVGGYIVEPDGSLAVSRTGGLAAAGSDGVAVVVVTGSKITITPFSKGMYIGPITATVTIPYYVRIKNVATLKTQVCTIKWGILKKMKATDPTAFKVKQFKNTKSCAANKDVISYFKEGNRLMPTIVVKRDRKWPTTYLGKEGSNGKGPKIWPRVKTWHLTIG